MMRFDVATVLDIATTIKWLWEQHRGCAGDHFISEAIEYYMREKKGRGNPMWVAEVAFVMGCKRNESIGGDAA